MALYLLKNGADPNIENKSKRTPIIYAAERGNGALIKALIQEGADIQHKDKWKNTALHLAIYKDQAHVIHLFQSAGLDLEAF